MPTHNWNDLWYLLALYRARNLTDAAHRLGVSDTTVARRIKRLEQALGTKLLLRSDNGRYEPTDAALNILAHAEAIEASHVAISTIAGENADHVTGSVRISAVPVIANHFLVPRLPQLSRLHPGLTIELVPTGENLDLTKREADLSIRFARPSDGGLRTKAQKLGALSFAIYAASDIPQTDHQSLGWITYAETHASLAQARWLEAAARSSGSRARLTVTDIETAMQAVAEGLGKSLLPSAIVSSDPRFRVIEAKSSLELPNREVWLLSHRDQASRLSITATKDWLASLTWN